ncbi:toprim domain-containing protein [Cupriavidus sp. UGS-1]|uniref:toprim domain-containing protein n=1 Tax=Cupriavidus sp. UGS-1 TaxID=2899826 RepID=UPI001E5D4E7F|nr:toprim domain-containing protein [Cupriavidus sp. UGS-1]
MSEAMRWLHDTYAIPRTPVEREAERREKTTVEYIGERCLANPKPAREYLVNERGISEAAVDAAIRAKTIGYNDYTSAKKAEGTVGYGGPAAAFLVRNDTSTVVGVDLRYFDPARNGDVKTQSQGDKDGIGWTAVPAKLRSARRVVIVESAINALSVDSCNIPGTASYALRGNGNASLIDFSFLRGKFVVICMDNDEPFPEGHTLANRRPGPEAAWVLYERLTALNIASMIVDQSDWKAPDKDGDTINDVNDYLQEFGAEKLAKALMRLEPWIIPGLPSRELRRGRPRLWLPFNDDAKYDRYRVAPDFTQYVEEKGAGDGEGDDGEGTHRLIYRDLCGFRIASISRVTIAGAKATMTGDPDTDARVQYAVTVQTPRDGAELQREVMTGRQLHNLDNWRQFGPIFEPRRFSRMLTILERSADLGARHAANFVGLAWRDGRLIVNEGPDCYFTNPDQQCPYANLTFPSGHARDARTIVKAYQQTFGRNAATIALVWALGGHLKALLGFWPHLKMQANKGAGKSTLCDRLSRSLAFTMFSGQSLQTEYRILTTISSTSHPVGWEELSARGQDIINKAVAILQESYTHTLTKRGTEMTLYVPSAPVLLAGEDVPVKSLTGKLVQTTLRERGDLLPANLPRFPVRQWLEFLTDLDRITLLDKYEELRQHCLKYSRVDGDDDGAKRMAANYAAVLLCWRYLCEFAGLDVSEGGFGADLLAEMNTHISESSGDRSPWVWILETVLSEIDSRNYKHPYKFETVNGKDVLYIRARHVMDHIQHAPNLREIWNSLPVKSASVFKRQLVEHGVTLDGDKEVEKTIFTRRVQHLTPLCMESLARYGLSVAIHYD